MKRRRVRQAVQRLAELPAAALLILPFPFVSLVAATAALLIALGVIAEDGVAIAIGQTLAVVSVAIYAVFGWLALAALGWV